MVHTSIIVNKRNKPKNIHLPEFYSPVKFIVSDCPLVSCVLLFATPQTVARGFSVHGILQARILECWSASLFPSPRDLPYSGIKPGSPALQADSLPSESPGKPLASHKSLVNALAKVKAYQQHRLGGLINRHLSIIIREAVKSKMNVLAECVPGKNSLGL